jgi:hypothetical protein
MGIKHKHVIFKPKKDISSTNIHTLYQCVDTRSVEVF